MTAITREFLLAMRLQVLDRPHYVNPREVLDLVNALRRVLDLRDEIAGPWLVERIDAALAGTQTGEHCTTCGQPINHGEMHNVACPNPQTDDGAVSTTSLEPGRIKAVHLAHVAAVQFALHDYFCPDREWCSYRALHDDWIDAATVAVETLTPLIEADLRERIAAEVEALPAREPERALGGLPYPGGDIWDDGYQQGQTDAARIVRGQS